MLVLLMMRSSIADDKYQIDLFVDRNGNGKPIKLTVLVKAEDTVVDLKVKIAQMINTEPERQMLRHKSKISPPLEDSKTMKDYGIEKDSVLHLTFDEYKIFVRFNEEKYPIWVKKNDNVDTLEEKDDLNDQQASEVIWSPIGGQLVAMPADGDELAPVAGRCICWAGGKKNTNFCRFSQTLTADHLPFCD
ncbi:hypothetical protein niasHT_025169 [Heterodera trifolii]|uniref:Ubiquitin-like domain-containing protein n=1 Tax=Heterodera trifolii TaxID=157864 RepID=A0ABD2JLH0_9BILA